MALAVEYSGGAFSGWEHKPDGVRTVQGALERAAQSAGLVASSGGEGERARARALAHAHAHANARAHTRAHTCTYVHALFDVPYEARAHTHHVQTRAHVRI